VDTEVRADPPDAVFAGPEGIELMPSVIDRAGELLRPDGVLALEHAESHGERVLDLLRATGHWSELRDRHDLSGRPRFVTARRVGAPRTAD
jgi:release factor glutamine methyltransferase